MADGGIRASDADRERVVALLSEQTSQGRLTLTEFEERTQQVYAARTWDELRALVTDLPVRLTFTEETADRRPQPAGPAEPAEPTSAEHWTDVAHREPGWLAPVLPLVMVAAVVLTVLFRLPFAAIIPILIVGRIAVRGGFGHHRRYLRAGRYGPHYR